MNEKDRDRIQELTIDEWVWVVFIILSILNIFGDEIEKHFATYHEIKDKEITRKIFNFTVFVSFLIYLYLAYKNYKKYINARQIHQNEFQTGTRGFASIFLVVASSCFLYAQLNDSRAITPTLQ